MTARQCARYLRETGFDQPSTDDPLSAYYSTEVEPTSDGYLRIGHKTLSHISDQFR